MMLPLDCGPGTRLPPETKGPQACRLRPWLWMKLVISYTHTSKPQALLKKRKLKKKKKPKRLWRVCICVSLDLNPPKVKAGAIYGGLGGGSEPGSGINMIPIWFKTFLKYIHLQ
ncbi:hypothetical protein [Desulfovibrio sp. Fe33]|uniref:hypothetical protein n=1 Tax=Desulfovibrio sp. Fe33 TaxID=3020842 RepID=UPI00234D0B32|nr:hypothetical protein [Desulfovibrio sp. Fe33]